MAMCELFVSDRESVNRVLVQGDIIIKEATKDGESLPNDFPFIIPLVSLCCVKLRLRHSSLFLSSPSEKVIMTRSRAKQSIPIPFIFKTSHSF
jgi:hypothetical protein